jgi:hypothetical protein
MENSADVASGLRGIGTPRVQIKDGHIASVLHAGAEPERYGATAGQKSGGRFRGPGQVISDYYQRFHQLPRPPFGLNRVCTVSQLMREVRK